MGVCGGLAEGFPRICPLWRCARRGERFLTWIFRPLFLGTGKGCDVWSPLSGAKGGSTLRLTVTQMLFAWEALENSPSLLTVRDLLAVVPDGRLLDALRRSRGHGRDDYPVQTSGASSC